VIGWLLDTNVVAELGRRRAEPRVVAWAAAQPEEALFISILTLAEHDKGIAALPEDDPSRARFVAAVAALEARFSGRVLSVDDETVRRWGAISGAAKRRTGRPPPVINTLLAASAIGHRLYLATRNVRDVEHSGALIFNPWADDPARFLLE
jgi:predicted nucleic acid-binding protein